MNLHYQDAMAIVRRYDKPQFLITMIANGNWNEIKQQLEKGQSYADRPDIVARVFEQKKKALIKDFKPEILGKFVSIVGVVEFQKRGLPHIHIILITENKPGQLTEQEIDKIICAEISDEKELPNLCKKLSSSIFMVHTVKTDV